MTKCSECRHEISTTAISCPQCGAVVKRTGIITKIFAWMLGLGITIGITSSIFNTDQQQGPPKQEAKSPGEKKEKTDAAATMAVALAKQIKTTLHDPDSMEIVTVGHIPKRNGKEGEGAYCFTFRAKNKLNAKALENTSYLVTETTTKRSDWNTSCAGKSGNSYTGIVKMMI